ncbi:hypothetical protein TWF281_004618 [Arthrobotrys megalospora]
MAELTLNTRPGSHPFPRYWNPNVFFRDDPDDPSPAIPTRDVPVYIFASAKNSGKQYTNGATIKLWVCNPSTVPTPENSQLVGHNVTIRFGALRNSGILAQMAALTLHNNSSVKVSISQAPKELFVPALAKFGVRNKVNVTEATRSGLVEKFVPGEPLPKDSPMTLEWESPVPNRARPFHAFVQLPERNIEKSAALFFVEQHDEKGKLVGGIAVIVVGSQRRDPPRIQAVVPAIPVLMPYRPYATDPRTGMMIPDGIFVSVLSEQNINIETLNDSSSTLDDLSIYIEGVADPAITTPIQIPSPLGGRVCTGCYPDLVHRAAAVRRHNKDCAYSEKMFVMGLSFDKVTKTFEIKVPQGSLFYHAKTVIAPKRSGTGSDCSSSGKCCCEKFCGNDQTDKPVPIFVKKGTLLWVPSPPYSGTHGPLPFEDPLNKTPFIVAAAILTLIALVALLIKLFKHDHSSGGAGLVEDLTVGTPWGPWSREPMMRPRATSHGVPLSVSSQTEDFWVL